MIIYFKAKMKNNMFVPLRRYQCDTKNNFITGRNVFQSIL